MPKTSSKYLKYEEIDDFLNEAQRNYPDLIEVQSIGKSFEGRDILSCIITHKPSGDHWTKPAMYIDGNHHAGEVTGSAVCLYTIEYLCENYPKDPVVKDLLDNRTFYIVPRVSPDGAELYLTTPYLLRSSVRPYPDEDLGEGLIPEDVDGDGLILQMRWKDPAGQWKVSEKDPRVMARRKPGEIGGEYYRVVTEGVFRSWNGVEIKEARPKWGLDLNRNYPGNWHPASQQTGPGPFPFSEPETRAIGDFFHTHPNIAMALSYHTSGGDILRPRTAGPDKDMNPGDLRMLQAIGRRGHEITGYPCVSIFEGFTVDQRRPSTGSFIDFTYDVLGIMVFAVELWDLNGRAGIPKRELKNRLNLSEDQQEEDNIKIAQFVDKELAGEGWHPWKPFNHPQLGEVELGGIDPKFVRQNAPPRLLGQECHKNTVFSLMLAGTLPRLVAEAMTCTEIGEGQYEFSFAVKNVGYLPTSSTGQAQTVKSVGPLKIRVKLEQGVTLVAGKEYEEIPHLPGWGQGAFDLEKKVRLVLRTSNSQSGAKLALVSVESQRAGTVSVEVTVP
ncbi:MAG: M14 family metallopeptidase [Bacillota bacterium]|jgi:murein tripeptide amidase MpaA